jgi:hypothetical protein
MCWNAEVSLKTFIYGTISALICTYLQGIPFKVIIITWFFTAMQLLEYFAWTYIDNKSVIYYLSAIGVLLIFMQQFLLSYFVSDVALQKIMVKIFIVYFILYCIFVLPKVKFNMKKGENGHLVWEWASLPPLVLFAALMLYIVPILLDKNYIGAFFTVATILVSLYFYYKYKTWGTMWCYFSNIIWVFFVLFSTYRYFYGVKKIWFWNY